MTLQSIEEGGLIRVDHPTSARDLDELGLVDFPRGAAGHRTVGGLRGERVDALLRAGVVDEAEVDERTVDDEPGLLARLAAGGVLEGLAGVRGTFRDAPGRAAVVVAARVDEQDLDTAFHESVEHG